MTVFTGNRSTDTGYTIMCENNDRCPAHENVEGSGKTVQRAYEISVAKYGGGKFELESSEESEPKQPTPTKPGTPTDEVRALPAAKKRGRPAIKKPKTVLPDEDIPL